MPKLRPSPIPSRIVRAAGALVWRPREKKQRFEVGQVIDPEAIEVLLVHRPRYDDWSWPKGKAELNEPILVAGVREVEEETGVVVTMGAPLTTQRYRLGSGHTKEVRYWVGTVASSPAVTRSRLPVTPALAKEIDTTRWVSPRQAQQMLTRRGDRRLLDELVTRATTGTLVTATLVVARHGAAVPRSQWQGVDGQRPLGRTGGRQALELVDILSALGIERLLSSSWSRCQATLSPYAAVSGLHVVGVDDLTEDVAERDPKAAAKIIKKLLRSPSTPIVVCGHRPVLPAMMRPLMKASSNQLSREYPDVDPYLRTAQILVAHVAYSGAQPRVQAIELHRPIAAPAGA